VRKRRKYTIRIFLTLAMLIAYCLPLTATIRYVSKTGSSIPPYTSWATAADSIMSAINISVFGDTIYVANGVYEEQVIMIPGLSLIGAGMDSCVIDTRNFSAPQSVIVDSDCLLKNFKIIVQNSVHTSGTGIIISGLNSIVERNEVLNGRIPAIWCDNTNSIIRHNRILYCNWGIYVEFNQPTIDSNYIYIELAGGRGINPTLGSDPIIRGNTIVMNNSSNLTVGYISVFNFSAVVQNNLFYSIQSDRLIFAQQSEILVNNIVFGNYNLGIYKVPTGVIKNNSVTGGETGIRIGSGNPPPQVQYNNVWGNEVNYFNHTPDSTNISADPMFVNEDSMDFHLQKYSLLIDAGDPTILDKDSTRSDIGLYGGPFGESYIYLDLPPRSPVNLTAEVDSSIVTLKWNRNTEADFNHYNLYSDIVKNFTIDSTKLVTSLEDTFYLYMIPAGAESIYFKLTAVDNQRNESNPSEEVEVLITSVEDEWQAVNNYILYQNYPNPFNPSTKIGYKLKERGYVKLYVYDIKGELLEILVNQIQAAGYYEVNFNAKSQKSKVKSELASGIYIYQIHVMSESNIPVFTDIKKMILIK